MILLCPKNALKSHEVSHLRRFCGSFKSRKPSKIPKIRFFAPSGGWAEQRSCPPSTPPPLVFQLRYEFIDVESSSIDEIARLYSTLMPMVRGEGGEMVGRKGFFYS